MPDVKIVWLPEYEFGVSSYGFNLDAYTGILQPNIWSVKTSVLCKFLAKGVEVPMSNDVEICEPYCLLTHSPFSHQFCLALHALRT